MRSVRYQIHQEWIAEQLTPWLTSRLGKPPSMRDIPRHLDITWNSGVCIIDLMYPDKTPLEATPVQPAGTRYGPQLWIATEKESGRLLQAYFHCLQEYPGFAEAVSERIIDTSVNGMPKVPPANAVAVARIVSILGVKWLDGPGSQRQSNKPI